MHGTTGGHQASMWVKRGVQEGHLDNSTGGQRPDQIPRPVNTGGKDRHQRLGILRYGLSIVHFVNGDYAGLQSRLWSLNNAHETNGE